MINITATTELFSVLGFSFQTWGSLVALGIIIGLIFMLIEARKRKLADKVEGILVFMMVSGLIFGRLAYILVNLSQFPTFYSWFELWEGGIISWGVLIGIVIGIFIFKLISRIKTEEILEIADLMAPYLILAIAIGRIGCFLRGCCYGIPTSLPWGVVYTGGFSEGAVHPAQLYHSIADFIIFFVLLKLYGKKRKLRQHNAKSRFSFFNTSGTIFLMFLMLYSAERFFIDFLRFHPSNEYYIIFSVTQWIFLAIFIVASVMLKIKEKKKK
jgi:phosphatidylglycerol:prolipoprotein diacylglycerol transferase